MAISDQIMNGKLQYDIKKEAAKISALSSGKLHKHKYLTGEDILPSNQQQIIEQTKFTYSSFGKALDQEIKTIEEQGEKQVDAIKSYKKIAIDDVIPKTTCSNEKSIDELNKIKEVEKNIDRNKLVYGTKTDTYDFRTFRAIRTFGDDISNGKITLEEANESQANLAEGIVNFTYKTRPKAKRKKKSLVKTCIISMMAERLFLMLLRVKYFKENQKAQVF